MSPTPEEGRRAAKAKDVQAQSLDESLSKRRRVVHVWIFVALVLFFCVVAALSR